MQAKAHKRIIFFFAALLCVAKGLAVKDTSLTIWFKPLFHNEQLVLNSKPYLTPSGDTITISKLRFYISSLQLVFSDGSVFREPNSYHLVDAAEEKTLFIKPGIATGKRISAITFNIGIDSLASVSGALEGDLDPVKGMYWAWNSGYINAKLEGNVISKTGNKEIEFHIGGYMQPYYAMRTVKLNLPQSESFFRKEHLIITTDVAAWFQNKDVKTQSRIVAPGSDAMKMADNCVNMFSIEN